MLHKNSASPPCDWQAKIFVFLTVYLTGSISVKALSLSFRGVWLNDVKSLAIGDLATYKWKRKERIEFL